MPTKAISALDTLTAPATGDWIPIVDVSDTSQGTAGSTKKIAASEVALLDLANTFTGAVTISGTAGNQLVVDTSVLVVDATNNRVGVNNAGPSYSLDVTGTFAVTGASTFSDNVTLANSKILFTDTVQARDSSGIQLFEDSGAGLTIADGGTATYSSDFIVSGALTVGGTAAFGGTATFSQGVVVTTGGINLGDEALSTYNQGTWTPAITAATTPPSSVTYDTQLGKYTQIGNVMYYSLHINVASISGGTGLLHITLPGTVANDGTEDWVPAAVALDDVDLSTGAVHATLASQPGGTVALLLETHDNSTLQYVGITAIKAGSEIKGGGFYFV